MPQIQTPDGQVFNFPDTMSRAQIAEALQRRLGNKTQPQQAAAPQDTSMGSAFKVADAQSQGASMSGTASLQRNLSQGPFGQFLQSATDNYINPIREGLGFDPIDRAQVDADASARLQAGADRANAEAEKIAEDLDFYNMTTSDINSVGDFVNFIGQKTAQAAPYMGAALASGGTLTYPFAVGEISQNLSEIEGLPQEKADDIAAAGGAISAALETLGIAKLLPKGTSNSILGGIASGVITEGTTEGFQELVNIGSEAVGGKQFSEGEILNRLKEAAAAGSVAGGAFKGSTQAASKAKSLFTSEGNFQNPNDMDPTSAQAAGDFARRLRTIADANSLNLRDVDPSSTKGSREAVDKAHIQLSEELKQRFSDLKGRVKPNDTDTFEGVRDKILTAAAYREGRNKTKSTVGQQEIDALVRLTGDTAEGQETLNLLLQLNQLTELHNEGYKGGVSQFTDNFGILGSGNGYDRARQISQAVLNPTASLGAAVYTGGASIPAQLGVVGAGRAIDKMTGRRSTVDRFVNRNENAPGLQPPSAPSLRDQAILDQQAQQAAEADAAQRAEAQKEAQRQLNIDLAKRNAPPTPESPQATMELATGLDRSGVARVIRVLQASNQNPALQEAIEGYRKSVAEGGKVNNLSPLIRAVNQAVDENPGLVERVRAPQTFLDQAPSQPQAQSGNQFTTPENYQAGKIDNNSFARTLASQVSEDAGVSVSDKAQLMTALEDVQSSLGPDPVAALDEITTELQNIGVNRDVIDTYFKPYRDRVALQQARVGRMQAPSNQSPAAPTVDQSLVANATVIEGAVRKIMEGNMDPASVEAMLNQLEQNNPGIKARILEITDPQQQAEDSPRFAKVAPVPFNNDRMQQMFGVEDPTPGGNYIDLDTKEDLTGNTYAGGKVSIVDGKPVLDTSDDFSEPATKADGRKVKVNLFKQKAGWKWIDYDGPATIVSTEVGGKHHYALSSDFQNPVTLQTYPNQPSEPRLRPTTQGEVELGNKIGNISVRGKVHPVYDEVRIVSKSPERPRFSMGPQEGAQSGLNIIDNESGLGQVPYNMDVDYRGARVLMKPSTFAKLALSRNGEPVVQFVKEHLQQGGKIGSPFLQIDLDDTGSPRVTSHEGRSRMLGVLETYGDVPVEVHLFPLGKRAKDLSPTVMKSLQNSMVGQDGNTVQGPLFKSDTQSPERPQVSTDGPLLSSEQNPLGISAADLQATNVDYTPTPSEIEAMRSGSYKPEKKRTLVEAAGWLHDKWAKATGRSTPFEYTPENIDRISSLMATEAMQALKNDGNAIGWYDRKLKAAKRVVSLVDPRVTQSPDAEAAFDYALAVTSNGQAVADNFVYALEVFRHFMDKGIMPTDTWIKGGERNIAMVEAFEFFNAYNASGQNMPIQEFLDSDFTVKELNAWAQQFNEKNGTNITVPASEGANELVKASFIIGPKIGQGFYQNIRGNYDPLTMDIWWMRMWNRLVGRPFVADPDLDQGRSNVKGALKTVGKLEQKMVNQTLKEMGVGKRDINKDPALFDDFVTKVEKRYQKFYKKYKEENGVNHTKPNFFKKTGTHVKNLKPQLQATPKGPGERSYMRQVTKAAIQKLKENGFDITTADFQALMWYPEKQLFRKMGVAPGRGADNDYLDAAIMLAEQEGFTNDQINQALPSSDGDGAVGNQSDTEGLNGPSNNGTGGDSQSPESPRFNQQPTGVAGILAQRIQGSPDGPTARGAVPDVQEVKGHANHARALVEIGKPGSEYENGIKDQRMVEHLAKAVGVTLKMFDDHNAMLDDGGFTGENRKRGENAGGVYMRKQNIARSLAPGATVIRSKQVVAPFRSYLTALHEVAHGIAGRDIEGNLTQNVNMGKNYLTGNQDAAPIDTLEHMIGNLATMPSAKKNKIIKEIMSLQDNESFVGDGVYYGVRPTGPAKKRLEGMLSGSSAKKQLSEDITNFEKYSRSIPEFTVDPLIVYLENPKKMKSVAPETAKAIRAFFVNSSKIRFYSHPLAMAFAVVMAMLMKQEQAEEEERQKQQQMAPGALTPPPGALSAA